MKKESSVFAMAAAQPNMRRSKIISSTEESISIIHDELGSIEGEDDQEEVKESFKQQAKQPVQLIRGSDPKQSKQQFFDEIISQQSS